MKSYAQQFINRFKQLRYDHKPLYNTLEIIKYEFGKFIIKQDDTGDGAIYFFSDNSKCHREFSCCEIVK